MDIADIQLTINKYHGRIDALEDHPIRNGRQIQLIRNKIAALEEAGRDVLATSITSGRFTGSQIDKNSYRTYASQVDQAYRMYDNLCDYGGEIFSSVADMRTAFIAGEGISFITKNQKKADFINAFLKYNNLNGSKLLAAVLMGEIEGKVLFVMSPVNEENEKNIKVRLFSWHINKYKVNRNADDYEIVESIEYTKTGSSEPKTIDLAHSLYIKLGGCNYQNDDTPTRLGKILTQCENASRATYDLRKNTHLFGKIMPYWKTADGASSKVINDALAAKSFEIGDGYAGPAEMSLLEPSGSVGKAIIDDLQCSLRYIASMTGIPIHWLAWPELMSNRATAENFLEVVSAATKKERLIWQESLVKLIDRVMGLAVDQGIAERDILDEEYTLKLPLISLATLQQMVDVWLPIYQEKLVSKFTVMNMLPGIDPDKELKLIEDERKEAAKNSPFNNMPITDPNAIDTKNPNDITKKTDQTVTEDNNNG